MRTLAGGDLYGPFGPVLVAGHKSPPPPTTSPSRAAPAHARFRMRRSAMLNACLGGHRLSLRATSVERTVAKSIQSLGA